MHLVFLLLGGIFKSAKIFVHIFMCWWKKMSGEERETVRDIVTQLSDDRGRRKYQSDIAGAIIDIKIKT